MTANASAPRSQPIRLAVIGAVLLIAMVYIVAGIAIYNSRYAAIASKERELQNVALIVSDVANRVFDAVKAVQIDVVARFQERRFESSVEFERAVSDRDTHQLLKNEIVGLPQVGALAVFNDQGKLLNSSRLWPVGDDNVSHREFFQTLQSSPEITAVLSSPVLSRTSNTWIVLMARKVSAPNGRFIGMVTFAIELQYFSRLFERLVLEPDSSISLYQDDGVLLARHPHVEAAKWRVGGPTMLFRKLLANADHGVGRTTSTVDARERIVAAHRVPDYRVAVTATATADTVLAEWRYTAIYLIVSATLAAFIVGSGVGLFIRKLRNHERLQREHAKQRENEIIRAKEREFAAALSNMSQGLSMFDTEQRLVMCNKRYPEMYGFTPEQVKPGTTLSQIVEYRIANGTYYGASPEEYRLTLREYGIERAAGAPIHPTTAEGTANSSSVWSRSVRELRDGRTIALVSNPMPDGGWVVTHEDITQYQKLQNEHDRNLTLISAMLENIPMIIHIKDARTFRYLLINRAGEVLHERPRDEMIGKDAHELFPKKVADAIMAEEREFMASSQNVSVAEHTRTPLRGEEKRIRLTRIKIAGKAEEVDYILGIVEDVSERRTAEKNRARLDVAEDG